MLVCSLRKAASPLSFFGMKMWALKFEVLRSLSPLACRDIAKPCHPPPLVQVVVIDFGLANVTEPDTRRSGHEKYGVERWEEECWKTLVFCLGTAWKSFDQMFRLVNLRFGWEPAFCLMNLLMYYFRESFNCMFFVFLFNPKHPKIIQKTHTELRHWETCRTLRKTQDTSKTRWKNPTASGWFQHSKTPRWRLTWFLRRGTGLGNPILWRLPAAKKNIKNRFNPMPGAMKYPPEV